MRITHIYKDSFPPVFGGIEQHIALLSAGQASRGHDVRVLVAGAPRGQRQEELIDGVRVTRLGELARKASSPVTLGFMREARRLDTDIAHFHHPNPIGEIAMPLLPRSTKTVVSYHADITRQRVLGAVYAPLRRRVLQRADRLLALSEPIARTSPVLTPLGRTVETFPYGVARPEPREIERIPGRLLFVGRLREYKGVPVLIDALASVPEAVLHVVGDGPMMPALASQVDALGLRERVRFLKDLTDAELDREYREAQALVLPSILRSEAFGLVLVEALMRGTPCISTELGTGTSWVNQDGVTGLVVPPSDAAALAMACRRILGGGDDWAGWSAGALARSEVFDADRMVDRVLGVYEELLRG